MIDLRLVAYAPNGARLGQLPHPSAVEVGWPLNDVPSLRVTYTEHAVGAEHLGQPCEVAVEIWDGTAWTEHPDSRFLRIGREGDETDRTGARSYTLPGYGWMLRKLLLYPPDDPLQLVDGKRPFWSATVGQILQTFLAEGHARGALPGLDWDFTTTHDSAGQPWAKVLTIYYDPGSDLLAAVMNLAEQGLCDWRLNGRTLQVFNEGTVLGRDLASGAGPVDLRYGRDIDEAPTRGTLEDLASAVLLKGEGSFNVEVVNHAAQAPWGRWEQYITQGGVSDETTALILAQTALEKTARERVQLTRGITPHAARWLPWRDYRPGDTILAPGDGRVMEPLRIRQITLTRDQNGVVGGNLTLNDRFLEREVRQARRAAGILGGSIGDGGTGVRPAPEQPKPQVPAAPLGVVVNPMAFIDANGYPQGLAVVSWGAVTHDVDGMAVDVDTYEVYMRRNLSGEPWYQVEVTVVGTESVTVQPLTIGWEYAFKVRATSRGTKGEFSEPVAVLIPDDADPPPVPTTPQVTTRLGVIHVAWDGMGLDPGPVPMPLDFDRVRVWMQDPLDPDPEPVMVDTLDAAGQVVIPDQPYGADREVWLTAVDRSGNESAHSEHVIVATQPIVDTDLIGQIIDGAEHIIDGTVPADAKIVAGSITGALIRAGEIEAGHIKSNAITADKIAAGQIQASHISSNAVTADKIQAGAITAQKLSADAIDGKTITGAFIRTAATGRRLELAPPGATFPEMRFYPAGSTNYSVLRTRDDRATGEATLTITSSQSATANYRAQLEMSARLTTINVIDSNSGNPKGGFLEISDDNAIFGWYAGSPNTECYIALDGSGRWKVIGRYWDFGEDDPYDAVVAGSASIGGGSAPNWAIFSYGPTMVTNMGPVVTLRDGASGGPTAFGNNFVPVPWALTASSTQGFQINLSTGSSFAFYFWAHRH